jgi:signal transduction histidine kinase
MQSYFIPILFAAFQFGIKGGLGTALVVSIFYLPHIMLQWGGLVETNLMRFLQLILFFVIGYLTGLKAQREREEKIRYQKTANRLEESLHQLQKQSAQIRDIEDRLHFADRLAIVGEMTASLAHEIRNPLGSIRGVVDILRDELPKEKKIDNFLNILKQETIRLNGVVDNYLLLAKRAESNIQNIDLKELIVNVHLLFTNRSERKNIEWQLNLPESPLLIKADPNELMQILINLILNAIQALSDGGKIMISSDYITEVPNKIILKIEDNGIGIDEKDKDQIFQPFYTTKQKGTGLGLAIVKRIVDKNDWKIKLESESNVGTSFIIYLN